MRKPSRRRLVTLSLAGILLAAAGTAQNSTRKIRVAPGETAARVGSAVPWVATVDKALDQANEKNRMVFWYIPQVAGSPMDRKPEIDRYQRGGPFSWPSSITLLRDHFVCTDEIPQGKLQQRFGLLRNEFIEPGYLVLAANGEILLRLAAVTTMQPRWFEAPLRKLAGLPESEFPCSPQLQPAWAAYRSGDLDLARQLAMEVTRASAPPAVLAEARWLLGAALCRSGNRQGAITIWSQLAETLPEEPLAWKAALEAEGHGPFVHGFEDYLPLPAAVLHAPRTSGSRAAGLYTEPKLWQRSIDFLLSMHTDGIFRDSTYDFGGTDSLPNVHAAVSCLAGMALLAAEEQARLGSIELSATTRERIGALLIRIREHAATDAWLALQDRDEIIWARAYALRFLVAYRQHDAEVGNGSIDQDIQNAARALLALQPESGVWFHEYGNPFAIATALQALHDARSAGVELDETKVERGLRALAFNRTEQGAFSYSQTRRGKPRASVEAAAGRMPLCELSLFLFGASDQERLTAAVNAGFEHHELLDEVRKYDDHANRFGYGGFFFWFDMLGRVEAIQQIENDDTRRRLLTDLHALVLDLPEFDGCFVDSHELGRVYGTAIALLCLQRVAKGR